MMHGDQSFVTYELYVALIMIMGDYGKEVPTMVTYQKKKGTLAWVSLLKNSYLLRIVILNGN